MTTKKVNTKRPIDASPTRAIEQSQGKQIKPFTTAVGNAKIPDGIPDVAFAAIASSKKQKEVGEFINYLLTSLKRNSEWLNSTVGKQNNFKCGLMVGAGPNRFQLQEIIYPSNDKQIKLEVETKDSEDHDKLAIAAMFKMSHTVLTNVLDFLKNRLHENKTLKEDLMKGKAMGVSFAVLRPFSERHYRVMERIALNTASPSGLKKKREGSVSRSPVRKAKKILL